MKNLIAHFSKHLAQAAETLKAARLQPAKAPIQNVLITGLGGSGIGGTITAELAASLSHVPIAVNKNYHIPSYVNKHSLVIVCSYSGNTEETLSALAEAEEAGAQIACISSGGKLKDHADTRNYNCLTMVGGNPPRSMLGFSFAYLLGYLSFYELLELDLQHELKASIDLLDETESSLQDEAKALAKKLQNTTVHILAVSGNLGVAARWRQQLNENAKMLCWEAEIPEMNHNELVGWEGGNDSFSALFLRNESDYDRNQKRIDIIKEIIGQKTPHVYEVWSKGESALQRALYLIHLGDWCSFYLSELNQVDVMDIKSIDLLKSELSKIPE